MKKLIVMEISSFSGRENFIGVNGPIEQRVLRLCSVHEIRIKFGRSMANNPEFRRVVNYTDLEALLDCMLCALLIGEISEVSSRSIVPRPI